jgi:hypothetical protein
MMVKQKINKEQLRCKLQNSKGDKHDSPIEKMQPTYKYKHKSKPDKISMKMTV